MKELIGFFSGAFVTFFGLLFWNLKRTQKRIIKPTLTKKEKEEIENSNDQELVDRFNKNRGK